MEHSMQFIEYPKALYMGGDPEAASVVVAGAASEARVRADGFRVVGEKTAKPASAPTPAPTAAPLKGTASASADTAEATEHTLDSARAALDAAGIDYKKTFGLKRLLELLPQE